MSNKPEFIPFASNLQTYMIVKSKAEVLIVQWGDDFGWYDGVVVDGTDPNSDPYYLFDIEIGIRRGVEVKRVSCDTDLAPIQMNFGRQGGEVRHVPYKLLISDEGYLVVDITKSSEDKKDYVTVKDVDWRLTPHHLKMIAERIREERMPSSPIKCEPNRKDESDETT